MKKLLLLLPVLLLLVAACKKKAAGPSNPYSNVTIVGGSPIAIPATASGGLYAAKELLYFYNGNTLDSSTGGGASAWFGNATTPVYAGLIIVNGDTLADSSSYPWGAYNPVQLPPVFASNAVTWSVSGNTSDSIPAFNYTDNTPFPVITGLRIPAYVSIDSGITLRFQTSGAYDYLYYWLDGGELPGKYDLTFTGDSANTASFSTSQLNQVIGTGALRINVYIAKLIPYTGSGKTFYLVKEGLYQLSTTVQ
jgi:hypothetical protein